MDICCFVRANYQWLITVGVALLPTVILVCQILRKMSAGPIEVKVNNGFFYNLDELQNPTELAETMSACVYIELKIYIHMARPISAIHVASKRGFSLKRLTDTESAGLFEFVPDYRSKREWRNIEQKTHWSGTPFSGWRLFGIGKEYALKSKDKIPVTITIHTQGDPTVKEFNIKHYRPPLLIAIRNSWPIRRILPRAR